MSIKYHTLAPFEICILQKAIVIYALSNFLIEEQVSSNKNEQTIVPNNKRILTI